MLNICGSRDRAGLYVSLGALEWPWLIGDCWNPLKTVFFPTLLWLSLALRTCCWLRIPSKQTDTRALGTQGGDSKSHLCHRAEGWQKWKSAGARRVAFSRLFKTIALFNISLEKSRAFGWCLIISWKFFLSVRCNSSEKQSAFKYLCAFLLIWFWHVFLMLFFDPKYLYHLFPLLIQKWKLFPIIDIIKIQYQELNIM